MKNALVAALVLALAPRFAGAQSIVSGGGTPTGSSVPGTFSTLTVTNAASVGGALTATGGIMSAGQVTVAGSSVSAKQMVEKNGNADGVFTEFQHAFAFSGTNEYRHNIRTRHNGSGAAGNAVDFYTWTPADGTTTLGSVLGMSLNNGSVGIGTASPCSTCTLHVAGGASVTGRITADGQPAVRAYPTGSQNLTTGSYAPVYAGSESFNHNITHVAGSSETFTVPVAGLYDVTCVVTFGDNTTGSRFIRLMVNGTVRGTSAFDSAADSSGLGVSLIKHDIFNLAASDAVRCEAFQSSGGPLNINGGADGSYISIYKLP